MCSVWSSSFRVIVPPQWKHRHKKSLRYWMLPHSKRNSKFLYLSITSASSSGASSEQSQLGYDHEELFGNAGLQTRKVDSDPSKPRSWFGPNGQYIRELPCPGCRGRGYIPCAMCGVERPRPDCSSCTGNGIVSCHQCHGDCVIWEESIDERPWENARSVSPLKVKEDDEVDNLDIKLDTKTKTKRAYRSSTPEVNLKISRSLKSLNAKTGIFSKRMKIIHGDPTLHAQRVAAIKKTKGTADARKRASEAMKRYFSDPKNRLKLSTAMKGIKFYCQECGSEGHRRHYCPETQNKSADRRLRCRVCREKGHNLRTCPTLKSKRKTTMILRNHHCKICGEQGHNRRTCPQRAETETAVAGSTDHSKKEVYMPFVSTEKGTDEKFVH